MSDQPIHEETLDPQDWDALKALGHQMVEDMMDYLAAMRERPVWQPMPPEVKADLRQPLPHEPKGRQSAYADFQRDVLPYTMGNAHPRFWAWVIGTGTPLGDAGGDAGAGREPKPRRRVACRPTKSRRR